MSGFELEQQSVSDKFERNQRSFQASKEDSNRSLLESLKHSANIAQDLAALYSERPYVYARVMKQLTGVLGASRVRRLHTTVQENARQIAERQRAEAEKTNRKSLHKSAAGAAKQGQGGAALGTAPAAGDSEYEISFLGLKTRVKLSSEDGTHSIECNDWNIPFLKSIQGKATIANADLTEVKFDAVLSAKYLREVKVMFDLKKQKGAFVPSGSFESTLEIPGLDGLNVGFKFANEGKTTSLEGSFATDATLFKSVTVGATGKVGLNDGNTSVEGTLSAKGKVGGKIGAALGEKMPAKPASGGAAAAGQGAAATGTNLVLSGTVKLNVTEGQFDSVSGELTAKGLGFLADPSSTITFGVKHTGEDFEASMTNCALKPYTIPKTQATVALTISEAKYSTANKFAAKAHVDVNLWDAVQASGDVEFDQNKLQAATLEVKADNFSIPGKKAGAKGGEGGGAAQGKKTGGAVFGGSLSGTLGIVDGAFEKANITGNVNMNIAKKTLGINLDSIDIDAKGAVKGAVSLSQPFAVGCATLTSCHAEFDTATEAILNKLDGVVKVDHPNLKSEEPGLSFNYEAGELVASGNVKVLQKDQTEIATSKLNMKFGAETLSATCNINLTNDFPIPDPQSKLKVLAGATAKVEIVDNELKPLEFSGNYKYGDAQEGGEKSSAKGKSAGPLAFSGTIQKGTYDLNTGAFNGTVSAVLESDVSVSGGCATLTLPKKCYDAKNDLTVTFVDSKPTTATGDLTGKVNLELKKGKDGNLNAYVTAKIAQFDFEKGEFTGRIMAKQIENYELYRGDDGTTIVLQGRRECGLNLDVTANTITDMDLDAAAKVTVPNENLTQKKVVFDADFKNVKLDLNTLAIINANAAATLDGDVEMNAHKEQTHVTIKDKSAITLDIKDSEVSSFVVRSEYEGNTSALHTKDPIIFKGSAGVNVAKKGDKYALDGEAEIELTDPCILDAIDEFDKITLKEKTKFGLSFSEEGLTKVTGDFYLAYELLKSEYIPNGFGAELDGKGIVCEIGDKTKVSGKFTLKPTDNIDIKLVSKGEAAKVEFSLLKKGAGMEAVLKDSKLKKLGGSASFNAKAGLNGTSNNAQLTIDEGNAKFGFDVETGDLDKLTVSADVNFKADLLGDKVSIDAQKTHATAEFDKEGIVSSTFNGKANIDIKRDGEPLKMELSGDLKYSRDNNFDGKVSLTCTKESKLGDFTHKTKTFEYGLGQAKGPAAKVDAEIVDGKVSAVSGSVGLFLRQTGEDDLGLLKIHGDVNFNYDCEKNILVYAEGKVSIEEKTLFQSNGELKESLVLKPSEATVTFENNQFAGIHGSVNLALADSEGGDYLKFSTKGDFDCLGENKFTGNVNASFCRDKALGKPTKAGYQFVMGEGGGFNCDITDNKIDAIDGSFNFKVKQGKDELFKGSVSGNYKPASEGGAESTLNAKGSITLQKDMDIDKEGKFQLGAGSEGGAEIKDNRLQTITGKLIVIINGPKTADGKKSDSKITVTATGSVDLEEGKVTKFEGKAALSGGAFVIASGLSLTRLDATVTIINNELQKIAGGAGIKYENKGFTVTGDAQLEWEKAPKDGEDKIGFNGKLSVTAFENKIYGEVGVDYKSYVNNGAPKINGLLNFKITDWLGGEIGLKFGDKGWDDPIVFGKMQITDAELMAARSLFNFSKDLGTSFQFAAGPVPINLGIGIGFGLGLNMQAIKFNGSIEVKDYHVKSPKGIPDFESELKCSTGLDLKAALKPYVSLGIGVSCFQAGIKVTGGANFKTSATAEIGGKLRGGEQGLGGEFGLGVTISGDFSVDVTPSLFANAFGAKFNKDIHTWTFDLGEIFKFTWGKKVIWDKSGTRLEDGGPAKQMAAEKSPTKEKNENGKVDGAFSKNDTGAKKEGAPNLPGSQELGNKATGKSPSKPDGLGGMSEKMEQAKNIAKALGSIGELVGLISGVITSMATAGPLGAVVYIAIKIIKGDLSIDKIKTAINNIRTGVATIKQLLGDSESLLRSILPDWVFKIYDFLKTATLETIKKKVMDTLKAKFKSYGSPLNELLQPVLKFIGNRFDYVASILELFKSGSASGIVKGIFKILGFAFSSIMDIINMVGEMVDIFKALVRTNVKNGNIYIYYKPCTFIDDYWWKFCIPGLVNWSGSTEKDGDVKTPLICKGLCALFGGCGVKKVRKK